MLISYRLRATLGSLALLTTFAAACSQSGDSEDQGSDALSSSPTELSAEAQGELGAAGFAADEIQAVSDSITISKTLSVKSFVDEANSGELAPDAIRRESHGKQHGCLRARFDVTTDSNIGVFQKGASYPAWIRISNGGAYQKDDKAQHISRGWGIKLMGVSGTPTTTQDFLFIYVAAVLHPRHPSLPRLLDRLGRRTIRFSRQLALPHVVRRTASRLRA